MDNLTHTLFGLTLARTALGRGGPGTTAALVISSNIPDIDIVTTASGAVSYLRWHRGPTHGPFGLIGLGLATAAVVWLGYRCTPRWRRGRTNAAAETFVQTASDEARSDSLRAPTFGMLAVVSLIGVAMHVLMDLPTSYGIRPLSPFDWHWYTLDWMPIIDIYLLIALLAGLAFGQTSSLARRRNASIVLMIMAANYGIRGAAHHQALAVAPHLFGPGLPQPCGGAADTASVVDRWPGSEATVSSPDGHRCLVEIAALPTSLSPFKWRVLARMSNAYEVRDLDVLETGLRDPLADLSRRVRLRYPNVWTPVVERAGMTRLGQVFLGFSRFPAARWTVDRNGVTTVRWDDMRFAGATLPVDQPVRPANLFTAIVRLAPDGRILEERLGR